MSDIQAEARAFPTRMQIQKLITQGEYAAAAHYIYESTLRAFPYASDPNFMKQAALSCRTEQMTDAVIRLIEKAAHEVLMQHDHTLFDQLGQGVYAAWQGASENREAVCESLKRGLEKRANFLPSSGLKFSIAVQPVKDFSDNDLLYLRSIPWMFIALTSNLPAGEMPDGKYFKSARHKLESAFAQMSKTEQFIALLQIATNRDAEGRMIHMNPRMSNAMWSSFTRFAEISAKMPDGSKEKPAPDQLQTIAKILQHAPIAASGSNEAAGMAIVLNLIGKNLSSVTFIKEGYFPLLARINTARAKATIAAVTPRRSNKRTGPSASAATLAT